MDRRAELNGIVVVDKPAGMTSAAAVDVARRALGAKKAGHTGTLDPLATGVLPVCVGEATKLAGYLAADDKAYECELALGVETDTLDRTGRVTREADAGGVTAELLAAALARFVGEHDQMPPMYSAIKIGGVRLHERARAGEEVERAARRVRIDQIELVRFAPTRATITIACGKGTYVRSLVADVGQALGCGAHVAELRRTRAGVFVIADAQPLDHLDPSRAVAMADATGLPTLAVADDVVRRITSGQQLDAARLGAPASERFQIVDGGRRLLAIARTVDGRVVYDRVFRA